MDKDFAQSFANEWIKAWNNHDISGILQHYADDFEMTSPVIIKLQGLPGGTLRGRSAVKAYWTKALNLNPNLRFELLNVFVGVDSIIINYKGHRGLSAEAFFFNADRKVSRAVAHYQQDQSL